MIWAEVQYREIVEGAEGPWTCAPRVADGDGVRVSGLLPGAIFEARARRVDDHRQEASRWTPLGQYEIGFTNPAPDAVRNLRVECGETLDWDPPIGDTLGETRFRVLHAPGEWRHYQDMMEATAGTTAAAPFDLCLVPKGHRTLCVIPVDEEGQEGPPAYLTVDRGPFDDADPITGRIEAGRFATGITDTAMLPGALLYQADVQSTGDAAPFYVGVDGAPFFALDAAAFYADSYAECSMDLRYNCGSLNGRYSITDDHAALTLDVTVGGGDNWKVLYRPQLSPFWRPDGTTPIDESAFYHGDGTDSKFWHGVDESDPFWGADTDEHYIGGDDAPYYDECPWLPFPGRLRSLEPQEMDLRLLFPAQTTRAAVSRFQPRESLVPRAGIDYPALDGAGLIDPANLPAEEAADPVWPDLWDDLRAPAAGINPTGGTVAPDVDTTDGSLLFLKNKDSNVSVIFQMPHAWREGSAVHPHIHWCKTTSAAGRVKWQMKYRVANIGEVLGAFSSFVDLAVVVADGNTANLHAIAELDPLVPMAGKTISAFVLLVVQRNGADGADDYEDTAKLLGVDMHYQIDSGGSTEELVK